MTSPDPRAAAQTLITDALVYGESPRWHDGRIFVSDVHSYAIKSVSLTGDVTLVAKAPARPAGIGFQPSGQLLVATAFDRLVSYVADGQLHTFADISPITTGFLNDMVVGGSGQAYVGATGYNLMAGEPPVPGQVVLIDPDGTARVVSNDVMFPNGICLTDEDGELYLAETAARRISRFDVHADGSLGPRRTWAELDSGPDGMCLDASGGAWVALLTNGEFVHVNESGRVDEVVKADGELAVACVTIGAERSELVLSSAHTTMAALSQGQSSSTLHRKPIATPGAGRP